MRDNSCVRLSIAAKYAYAAATTAGARLVFAAGACPLDDEGPTVGVGDARAQASIAIANLRVSLAGAGLYDVVRTTVHAPGGVVGAVFGNGCRHPFSYCRGPGRSGGTARCHHSVTTSRSGPRICRCAPDETSTTTSGS